MTPGEKFLDQIMMLAPEEFIAFAHLLNIKVLSDRCDSNTKMARPRDAIDIMHDMLNYFLKLERSDRRFLLRRLIKINGGKKHGINAEIKE